MKSFTVESILADRSHEKTFSTPVCTPVQHDVIVSHHQSPATRQQQLGTDQGSFITARTIFTVAYNSMQFHQLCVNEIMLRSAKLVLGGVFHQATLQANLAWPFLRGWA